MDDVRLTAVEHYDAAVEAMSPPHDTTNAYLHAIAHALLGILRVEMARLEEGGQ